MRFPPTAAGGKKLRYPSILRRCSLMLAGAALAFCLAGCGAASGASAAASSAAGQAASDAGSDAASDAGKPQQTAAAGGAAAADADGKVDLTALEAQNPDVYGYLTLVDTTIQYPVLQRASDDAFYLEHNFDGSLGRPGVIYSEGWNKKDFSDFNTILYGHDMNDLSMFGTLEYYRDPAYLDAHRDITLQTDSGMRRYKIFAAVVYDDRYLPYAFDFTTETGRQSYLDVLSGGRNINDLYRDDLNVTTADKLLTLSTCVSQYPNERYLVVAKYLGGDAQ